jgi:hypothetical protein
MSNPFDFFEEIFCINLDRRKDRWVESLKEFDKVGITERVRRFSGFESEIGWEGCSRSHRFVWELAREWGLKNVLIFEDDVQFKPNAEENLRNSLSQLNSWDWLFLGCNLINGAKRVSEFLIKPNGAFALHAYAINMQVFSNHTVYADLHDSNRVDVCVNHGVVKNKDIKCYATYPMIATQRPSMSDIENWNADYSHMDRSYDNIQ